MAESREKTSRRFFLYGLSGAVAQIGMPTSLVQSIASELPVRLTTGDDLPPFSDPKWPNGGFITDVVVMAFKEAGMPIAPVEFAPWKRGYRDVQNLVMDATFPYVHTPERDDQMKFSDVIYDSPSVALFAADSPHDYTGPDSVTGLTMCLPLGNASPLQALVDSGAVKIALQPSDYALCLKAVIAHRADFMTANEAILIPLLRDPSQLSEVRVGRTPVQVRPTYLIVDKRNARADEIIDRFNVGLAALKESGAYDAIFKRHFGIMRVHFAAN